MSSDLSQTPSLPPQVMLKPSELTDLVLLGQGSGTRVWRGRDAEGNELLLKTFSLADAPNWKAHDLFEREAKVLQHLVHPRLPRLLAYGNENGTSYLIYPFVPGQSLEAKLAEGWRPAQGEALGLIRQLLEILVWLHDRQPPVVHRDIKPSNLILTPDKQLFLIDFGAVLLHLRPDGGSTVAGTFGYMAPEQLTGRSLPASDLYSVGATLIQLLSGRAPAALPQERLWIRFEQHVKVTPALGDWIRSLIHPVVEERCPDACTAIATLEQALSEPERGLVRDSARGMAHQGKMHHGHAHHGKAHGSSRAGRGVSIQSTFAVNMPQLSAQLAPMPRTYAGLEPIRTEETERGLEIVLPRRARSAATGIEIRSGIVWIVMMLVFGRIYGALAGAHLSGMYILAALGIAGAAGLVRHGRRQLELFSQPSRLVLTAETLTLDSRPGHHQPIEIPWQMIGSLYPRRRNRGIRMRYIDPLSGRRRRMHLARGLTPEELAWLAGVLLAQQSEAVQQLQAPQD